MGRVGGVKRGKKVCHCERVKSLRVELREDQKVTSEVLLSLLMIVKV